MTSNLRKLIFFVIVLGVALIAYQYMIKPANEHLAQTKFLMVRLRENTFSGEGNAPDSERFDIPTGAGEPPRSTRGTR